MFPELAWAEEVKQAVEHATIHFDWQHVAWIGGAISLGLLALIGTLLTIILKRQGSLSADALTGIYNKFDMEIAKSEEKLDKRWEKAEGMIDKRWTQERTERDKKIGGVYKRLEDMRLENKKDVGGMFEKIENLSEKIITQFKEICDGRQRSCSGLVHSELEHQNARLKTACEKIAGLHTEVDTVKGSVLQLEGKLQNSA